jgi:glutamate N-acetyltransferase/amino-acid N-acetyltransferase
LPHLKPPRGIEVIDGGTVTSPLGFVAGAAYAGIKTLGTAPLDLGILSSERAANVAAMFTRSAVKGAAVIVSREHARNGSARGVIVNSGISNVGTGDKGMRDAREMCALGAGSLAARRARCSSAVPA